MNKYFSSWKCFTIELGFSRLDTLWNCECSVYGMGGANMICIGVSIPVIVKFPNLLYNIDGVALHNTVSILFSIHYRLYFQTPIVNGYLRDGHPMLLHVAWSVGGHSPTIWSIECASRLRLLFGIIPQYWKNSLFKHSTFYYMPVSASKPPPQIRIKCQCHAWYTTFVMIHVWFNLLEIKMNVTNNISKIWYVN